MLVTGACRSTERKHAFTSDFALSRFPPAGTEGETSREDAKPASESNAIFGVLLSLNGQADDMSAYVFDICLSLVLTRTGGIADIAAHPPQLNATPEHVRLRHLITGALCRHQVNLHNVQ